MGCLRSRKSTNAPIEAGYNHSVPAIMAMRAMDTGRRQVYDAATRTIREGRKPFAVDGNHFGGSAAVQPFCSSSAISCRTCA